MRENVEVNFNQFLIQTEALHLQRATNALITYFANLVGIWSIDFKDWPNIKHTLRVSCAYF